MEKERERPILQGEKKSAEFSAFFLHYEAT
jgi:hypothetical protein